MIDQDGIDHGLVHQPRLQHGVDRLRRGEHAEHAASKPGIVEPLHIGKPAAPSRHDDVGRAIIRVGRLHDVRADGVAHHDVAEIGIERVAGEARTRRRPEIAHRLLELIADDVGDLVLEPLPGTTAERHVGRIGANAKRGARDEVRHNLRRRRRQLRGEDDEGCSNRPSATARRTSTKPAANDRPRHDDPYVEAASGAPICRATTYRRKFARRGNQNVRPWAGRFVEFLRS